MVFSTVIVPFICSYFIAKEIVGERDNVSDYLFCCVLIATSAIGCFLYNIVLISRSFGILASAFLTGAEFGWRNGLLNSLVAIFTPSLGSALANIWSIMQKLFVEIPLEEPVAHRPFRNAYEPNLDLEEHEFLIIYNEYLQLNNEEITSLQNSQITEITSLLEEYLQLKQRLSEDECPILCERPSIENTIVLMKQYRNENDVWLPIPNTSVIFDKPSLTQLHHQVHPLTRDSLITPSEYELNGTQYPTRYRFHRYYSDSNPPLEMSQALNQMALTLKSRLQDLPAPRVSLTLEELRAVRLLKFTHFLNEQKMPPNITQLRSTRINHSSALFSMPTTDATDVLLNQNIAKNM